MANSLDFYMAVRKSGNGETVFLYEARASKTGAGKAARNSDKQKPQMAIDNPIIRVSKFRASEVNEC